MPSLVSILIPAYNAERWLADSIRSALAQTWENKEVIVVDDGSKDNTLKVAEAFRSQRVTVVSQKNQGASAARNHAFSISKGDYIQWLDADDLLAPDKVARQMEAINPSADRRILLSSAWGSFYYCADRANFSPSSLWADQTPVDWLRNKLGQNCFMQTATWLVSRELSEAAGTWDTRLLGDDDGEYFCRVIRKCDAIRFVRESKVYYRDIGTNRLSAVGFSTRKLEAHFFSMKLHIGYLRELSDDPRSREACVRYLQRYFSYYYQSRPDIVQSMEGIASELGGTLRPPRVRMKYYWIQLIFGWRAARRAEFVLPKFKAAISQFLDKLLFSMRRQTSA